MYKIRDWEKHFERDRTKQYKNLQWFPVSNKQGTGYRKIMAQKNGLEIYAVWIALLNVASKCKIRGDLKKYDIDDLSILTMIDRNKLNNAIIYLSQTLDWIEVITINDKSVNNLDKSVNNLDKHSPSSCVDGSILFNSIQSKKSKINNNIKIKYLDYVFLKVGEYEKLVEQFKSTKFVDKCIEQLDLYIPNAKTKYKDHYRVILKWVADSVKEKFGTMIDRTQEKQAETPVEERADPKEVKELLKNVMETFKTI